MLHAHIVTLFPEVCEPYFKHSILGRAVERGVFAVQCYNPIDMVPTLKRVDARPYGGGPGMVLQAQPFLDCYEKIQRHPGTHKTIFLTPAGEPFTQAKAKEYASFDNISFLCGHYEGIDERVAEITQAEKVSIGDFTLTGGEIPAMAILDAVVRELPDVLGNEESLESKRVASPKVYTRPETLVYDGKEYTVPEVLLSGHHKEIEDYRKQSRDMEGVAPDADKGTASGAEEGEGS